MKSFFYLLTAFVLFALVSNSAFSQVKGGYFDQLAEFYEQEMWEDCAFKADRLLLRNKHANDPELYLYLAMSYHKIYLDTSLNKHPEYENAYDLALKNLVNAKRKDRVGEYFPTNNFAIEDIVKSGIPIMLSFAYDGKFSKSASMMRSFQRLTDDAALYFYNGAISFFNFDNKLGQEVMDSIMPIFKTVYDNSRPEMKPVLSDGLKLYFDFLMEDYYIDSAENLIDFAVDLFPNDTALLRRSLMDFDSLKNE
jgi:hypothetical protein